MMHIALADTFLCTYLAIRKQNRTQCHDNTIQQKVLHPEIQLKYNELQSKYETPAMYLENHTGVLQLCLNFE